MPDVSNASNTDELSLNGTSLVPFTDFTVTFKITDRNRQSRLRQLHYRFDQQGRN